MNCSTLKSPRTNGTTGVPCSHTPIQCVNLTDSRDTASDHALPSHAFTQNELEQQEKELRDKLVQLEADKSNAFKMFRKLLSAEDEVTATATVCSIRTSSCTLPIVTPAVAHRGQRLAVRGQMCSDVGQP
jgi:hypothetical protein